MRVLAIADDLTGALEVGAKFAEAGLDSVVTTAKSTSLDHGVLVVDTETRHLTGAAAEEIVGRVAAIPAGLVYKKTDSTLRGNIGVELRALSRRHPGSRIAYVPAYPAVGRTVRYGVLYVHGERLDQSAFARDPLNPIRSARVDSVLPEGLDCEIFDGETDEDIERAARLIISGVGLIAAGPGALAGAIAGLLGGSSLSPTWPHVRSCLVVNGSLHPVSREQVEAALRNGPNWPVVVPSVPAETPALECACHTAQRVCRELDETAPDALIVFGGDTAFAIIDALGSPMLRPIGEILPGVPVSRIDGRSTILITKAGGFGDSVILRRLEYKLNG